MQPPSEAQKQVVKPGILALLSWLPFGVEDAQRTVDFASHLMYKNCHYLDGKWGHTSF